MATPPGGGRGGLGGDGKSIRPTSHPFGFFQEGGTSAPWRKGWHVDVTHTKGWHVAGVKTPQAHRATLLRIWPTCHPFGDFCKFRHGLDVHPFFFKPPDVPPFWKKGWHVAAVGGKNQKGWHVEPVADKADVLPFWRNLKRVGRRAGCGSGRRATIFTGGQKR